MDLEKAKKKIRNAWIAGLVPTVYFLYFIVKSYATEGTIDTIIVGLIITVVSFGLSIGIYKKNSRVCAIALFIWIIFWFTLLMSLAREYNRGAFNDWDVLDDSLGLLICVSFALLYFTFEGIRGTFTYSKLIKKQLEK